MDDSETVNPCSAQALPGSLLAKFTAADVDGSEVYLRGQEEVEWF